MLKKEKFKEAIIILRDAISLILTKRHYNYNIVAELYRDIAVAYSKLNSDRYGLKMNLCSIKYYEGSKNKDKRDLKNYINALLSAINIYFKYNKYEKAKNHINKILKYDKNNFKAIYFLAVIYYKESDFKNAEKFIIKALRLCKNTEIKLELWVSKNLFDIRTNFQGL